MLRRREAVTRMRLRHGLGGVLLVALVCASCGQDGDERVEVRGSGRVIIESREVSGFDEIVLRGFGDVIVEVTGTESLTIEAEDSILPYLTSEVVSGRLELGAVQNSRQQLSPTRDVVFRITADDLVGASVEGSGGFTIAGIATEAFSASISGSGIIAPSGTCDALAVDIGGSGTFEGEGLIASAGTVTVSGSGSAVVNATEVLTVLVSGSGTVEYLGTPALTRSVSGTGEVRPR